MGEGTVPARHRPSARRLLAGLVVAATVVAGCGISEDDGPRALAVSTSTTEPPSVPSSGPAAGILWLVREGNLVPVARSIPDRRVATVLEALLDQPDQRAQAAALSTSIPSGTELRGIEAQGDGLAVDLSRAFEGLVGPAKQQAIAQLVLTATDFPGITTMRFLVAGRPIPVASPTRGDTATVEACDFSSLLPTDSAARELGLSEESLDLLEVRRTDLAGCPTGTTGG